MKLTRYSASGSTHRKGTLEMFCVMWLVTASSITEPIAESASQSSCSFVETAEAARRSVFTSKPFMESQAVQIGRHTSELQSQSNLVCRLLLEKKKKKKTKKKQKKE